MKRAIVFGATGGIGQAVARDLAQSGWSIYLHYSTNVAGANDLQRELSQNNPQQDFFTLQFDFANPIVDLTTFANLLPVNALIFAQGVTNYNLFGAQDTSMIDTLMQVNLITPLKIINYFESQLLQYEASRIILFGSVYGHVGSAMETVYSTVKGAVSSFVNAYAKEVASTGMTVNVIAPGAVMTPMNAIFPAEEIAEVSADIPIGRFAKPEEISYWVKTILHPDASYLTGQTIYVDGGWLV